MTKPFLIIVFLLINIISFYSCTSRVEKPLAKTELELTAQPGGIVYLDTTHTIYIATTLYNPTSDTMDFVTMTCSYEDMFLTDTTAFTLQSRYDCYSNFPVVYSIPPHAKLDQFIMVRPINKNIQTINCKIRIGMYYLKPKKENGFQGIFQQHENRTKAKILWSNEIDMKRLYRRLYQ